MPVHRLYLDFIRFLDEFEKGVQPWEAYQLNYLNPNSDFLVTYWKKVDFSLFQIQERVERVRKADYSNLLSLLHSGNLEELVESTIQICTKILLAPNPDVYLFVGFFSSDGFVIELSGKPVIGIGLERFRDFDNLSLILTHEYCHYYLKLKGKTPEIMRENRIFSEGTASLFSQLIHPKKSLYRHLFFTRARLNSCIQAEFRILSLIRERSIKETYSLLKEGDEKMGIPPRAGNYISYRLVQDFIKESEWKDATEMLESKGVVEKWNRFIEERLKLKDK